MQRRYLSEDDESALLAVSGPALLSLLEQRRDTTLRKLEGEYYAGTLDLRPTFATYVAYVELIRDIENKIQNRDHKEKA